MTEATPTQPLQVFLDLDVNGTYAGRLTFELFEDTPLTAENFKSLCTGERGNGQSGVPLHYKGSKIHKIFPDYIIQGGDFTRGDGRGGESIYGPSFPDENYIHKHSGPGLLAMTNIGKPDTSNSQFFISVCQQPLEHLDGKYVVFGRLRSGAELLQQIAHYGHKTTGVPTVEVVISDCGICPKKPEAQVEAEKVFDKKIAEINEGEFVIEEPADQARVTQTSDMQIE